MRAWLKENKLLLIIFGIAVVAFIILDFSYLWFTITHWADDKINEPIISQNNYGEPNILTIPSLGITAPIVYAEKNDEKIFQQALKNGVVHFPDTANPGELGNCYIFGHSSDYIWSNGKYKTIFAPLTKIEQGAEITITDNSGKFFKYIVTKTFVTSPTDLSVLDQGNNQKRLLTLQTSWPLGTALKRFIVVAEMKEKTPPNIGGE